MAEFAKQARIEFSHGSGKIVLDGAEFPWHVTGFSLSDAEGGVRLLTLDIPVENAHVAFDAYTQQDADQTPIPAHTLFPPDSPASHPSLDPEQVTTFGGIGDVVVVGKGSPEPDKRLVFRYLDEHMRDATSREYLTHMDGKWAWVRKPDDPGMTSYAHTWDVVTSEWPGRYQVARRNGQ